MYELKKIGKAFTSKSVGTGPTSYIYIKKKNLPVRGLTKVEKHRHKQLSKPYSDELEQCFSTAGSRPGTGPWQQLYRAARGLRKLQYATRFH